MSGASVSRHMELGNVAGQFAHAPSSLAHARDDANKHWIMMVQRNGKRDMFRAAAALTAVTALGVAAPGQTQISSRQRPLARGSRLEPSAIQILFADLQVPLVATSRTMLPAELSTSAAVLANVAAVLKLPSLFSVVLEGNVQPHLLPELQPFATSANTILRMPVSPFHDAPTVAALRKTDRRTLVIAGFAAEAVILQTALDAIAAGYTVFYVVDAVGSKSERTEAAAFREIESAGAIPTSVLSLSLRLVNDLTSPNGRAVFAALQPILER